MDLEQTMKAVGTACRLRRKERKHTIVTTAVTAELSTRQVQDIEQGKNVKLRTLLRLMDFLDLTIAVVDNDRTD